MENDDYIDTVVLVRKPDSTETAPYHDVIGRRSVPVVKGVQLTRSSDIEISSLTIDETFDGDTDPYNSTGKHCVLKIKE